jgi:hypothetical protein
LPTNAVTHRQLRHALGHDLKAQSGKAAISMIIVWVCQPSATSREMPAIIFADIGYLKDSSATIKSG